MIESPLNKPRTLEAVLDDGQWHPVLGPSGKVISRYEPLSLWISETPEYPLGDRADHSSASAFLVEMFVPITWIERAGMLSAHGHAVNLGRRHTLNMVILAEGSYIKIDKQRPDSSL